MAHCLQHCSDIFRNIVNLNHKIKGWILQKNIVKLINETTGGKFNFGKIQNHLLVTTIFNKKFQIANLGSRLQVRRQNLCNINSSHFYSRNCM